MFNFLGNVCIVLFVIFMIVIMIMIEYIEKNYMVIFKRNLKF